MSRTRILATAVAALTLVVGAVLLPGTPSAATTKDPVILVPGFTTGPILEPGYYPLRARLQAAGYDVTLISYPDYGLGDITVNAQRLASVRARTGAAKVDIVSHSMGGLVSRTFVKSVGGASQVDSLIMLGTPNYGTALANVASFFTLGSCVGITACQQMAAGSTFLAALNAGDDTIGSVRYTSIATLYDEIVFPYSNAFLANDGNIANVTVQAQCPLRFPGHLTLITDGAVADGILDALRGEAVRMSCFAL